MMIQDIEPHEYHLDYSLREPEDSDRILIFQRQMVLAVSGEELRIPQKKDLKGLKGLKEEDTFVFLFGIDDESYFLLEREYTETPEPSEGFRFVTNAEIRTMQPAHLTFAAATGQHLAAWYRSNIFCGRCGSRMVHDEKERAQRCPACGGIVYPRINPSCIIGIRDREKDRLLVTQYNPMHFSAPTNVKDRTPSAPTRPAKHYALVAGYIEIGESGEMTVKREVMEEVGLKVKNIRYFASQPWAFSSSFLLGYICDLDGSDKVKIEENELSEAVWLTREEMPDRSADFSLTSAIMEAFRKGEI